MSLLGVLFSANKRKWFSEIPDNKYEEDKGIIIKNFMLHDNICYDKYKTHLKWESNQLSIYQDENDMKNCSISYRKYFSGGYSSIRLLNNEELGHSNNWFYMAYPDVAYWFGENYDNIRGNLLRLGYEFSYLNHKNFEVFRYVVTMYKEKFGRLEMEV